ncbi:hypothetical protein [Allorhizocola rhizosphaerae]|uniref:hypothetical protein n=1 Tax=Allorhizocola rhizosphaerae TaxID=1872709 RepID=UPI0013C2B258|nr:hypothetical protein [Allorhizocola rhizosphaerae]
MRFELGRLPVTALACLMLATASACGEPAPNPTTSASIAAGDPKAVCDTVMEARKTALDALAPVSSALARDKPSAADIAKATDDLKTAFTAMHSDVAGAAEHVGDTQLKEKLSAYQLSIEEAIVVVEGADGDKTKLAAAIDLPSLRSAEHAVMAACP